MMQSIGYLLPLDASTIFRFVISLDYTEKGLSYIEYREIGWER